MLIQSDAVRDTLEAVYYREESLLELRNPVTQQVLVEWHGVNDDTAVGPHLRLALGSELVPLVTVTVLDHGEQLAKAVKAGLAEAEHAVRMSLPLLMAKRSHVHVLAYSINEAGTVHSVAFRQAETPEVSDLIDQIVSGGDTVACLFVVFDDTTSFRAAEMHQCYPESALGVSRSSLFVLDPDDHNLMEMKEESVPAPDTLAAWLQESLGSFELALAPANRSTT